MVLDDEAISDHNFIYFELGVKGRNARRGMDRQIVFFNKMKFRSSVKALSKFLLTHSNINTEMFTNPSKWAYKDACSESDGSKYVQVP